MFAGPSDRVHAGSGRSTSGGDRLRRAAPPPRAGRRRRPPPPPGGGRPASRHGRVVHRPAVRGPAVHSRDGPGRRRVGGRPATVGRVPPAHVPDVLVLTADAALAEQVAPGRRERRRAVPRQRRPRRRPRRRRPRSSSWAPTGSTGWPPSPGDLVAALDDDPAALPPGVAPHRLPLGPCRARPGAGRRRPARYPRGRGRGGRRGRRGRCQHARARPGRARRRLAGRRRPGAVGHRGGHRHRARRRRALARPARPGRPPAAGLAGRPAAPRRRRARCSAGAPWTTRRPVRGRRRRRWSRCWRRPGPTCRWRPSTCRAPAPPGPVRCGGCSTARCSSSRTPSRPPWRPAGSSAACGRRSARCTWSCGRGGVVRARPRSPRSSAPTTCVRWRAAPGAGPRRPTTATWWPRSVAAAPPRSAGLLLRRVGVAR